MAAWSCSGNLLFGTLTGLCAQTHENFRIPGFLSIPAFSDHLGAARREGQCAVKGSDERGGCYLL
jgi:hypothetical protein